MDSLTVLRETLDRILAEASADLDAQTAARSAALDQRERELVAAMECATVDHATRSAWRQSAAHRSQQVLTLIDAQLEYFSPKSNTTTVLQSLRRMVAEL
jgi:hypothetical protein